MAPVRCSPPNKPLKLKAAGFGQTGHLRHIESW